MAVNALREAPVLVLALQLASLAVCLLGSSISNHPLALTGASQRCHVLYILVYFVFVHNNVYQTMYRGTGSKTYAGVMYSKAMYLC